MAYTFYFLQIYNENHIKLAYYITADDRKKQINWLFANIIERIKHPKVVTLTTDKSFTDYENVCSHTEVLINLESKTGRQTLNGED